ncbi:BAG family molecular chaperone regulator 8, chloroplastic [Gastrolobium bilobum]|uniref:BAG family molecular chaperone regulator 8, chloroplastic n=1 Tax=Gastrolobium bilobum TaxID=150636 RepID=UPI002AAFB3D5|nr:BAG family molecular chaperone regulator 8, chloroplastic [Gastrolobium bilobum]
MASHNHHHPHPHQAPPPSTHCCCNPSYTCCSTSPHHPCPPPPPPPPQDHLVQAIASLLSQPHPIPSQLFPHYTKSHTHHNLFTQNNHLQPQPQHQHQNQTHSTISSLLHRIESLESSLNHHTRHSLRDAAARIIQTHFRSFLVRRSRTLRHLKHLAFIKSTFNALKSSFSNHTHIDFAALSLKAMDLLLELDSIQGCDPMIVEGKRSISRDLVQFLDSIEEVAAKKRVLYVKAAKNARSVQKVHKPRNSGDEEKRKLLQNLRGRVEKISRLFKVSANDEEDSEPEEGINHDDGITNVLIGRRDEVSLNKNGVFVQRQGVQPRVKKSVRFAENGNICEVYNSSTCEPDLSGNVTCSDGNSSSDDQGEVLEDVNCAVEDVVDSSQGAEDDEEVLVVDSGGSSHSSGERNSRRDFKYDGRNKVKGQLQAHEEKLLFSAPMPIKMENRTDLKKSKGVKILT